MEPLARGLEEVIARRERFLVAYQSARYARRYRDCIERVKAAEARIEPGSTRLAEAVAKSYFKLLAYKDEYEVARLHAHTPFLSRTRGAFDGEARLKFYLSPPVFARLDPETGRRGSTRSAAGSCRCSKRLRRSDSCAARRWIRSVIPPSAAPTDA